MTAPPAAAMYASPDDTEPEYPPPPPYSPPRVGLSPGEAELAGEYARLASRAASAKCGERWAEFWALSDRMATVAVALTGPLPAAAPTPRGTDHR